MTDEGYIKFDCDWHDGPPITPQLFDRINPWRQTLHHHGLIGVGNDGIGFGNISVRNPDDSGFFITGTATGSIAELTRQHYTRVVSHDLSSNRLTCRGLVQASSESLTHAALYEADPAIHSVAHVHCAHLWEYLLHRAPTTSAHIPYGTPEMGREMIRLYRESDLPQTRLLVMAGHKDGLISFGADPREAVSRLLDLSKNEQPPQAT